ncbi:hypothetical protein AB64_4438 [Escherichia coli 2-427-07_S1_C3]|nr:hypothetical protein AB64_4438 [Escherichia coli 2-427-07_S1_C3]
MGTLETSGVVIHFILRALVILVLAFLIKTPWPAGSFKGVVLVTTEEGRICAL